MIKNIAFIDQYWGRIEERDIVGDMYFTFQVSPETRCENPEELKESCKVWSLGDSAVEADEVYDEEEGHFAIYEVFRADFEFEEEEEDNLWSGVQVGDSELLLVCVCATEEQAGWVRDMPEYKGIEILFRNE